MELLVKLLFLSFLYLSNTVIHIGVGALTAANENLSKLGEDIEVLKDKIAKEYESLWAQKQIVAEAKRNVAHQQMLFEHSERKVTSVCIMRA